MSRYSVYKVVSHGFPLDHHAIVVEMNTDGSSYLFQVTGTTQVGMTHGHKPQDGPPEDSATFAVKDYLGSVLTTNYAQIEPTVNGVEPPKKQFQLNKRLYPQEKLRTCQEWTTEAIQALREANVLQTTEVMEASEDPVGDTNRLGDEVGAVPK